MGRKESDTTEQLNNNKWSINFKNGESLDCTPLTNSVHQLYTMRYELRPVRVTEEKLHGSKKPGVKLPSRSSPLFYIEQRTFSPEERNDR